MHASTTARLLISTIILIAATACGDTPPPDGHSLVAQARRIWAGDWHAVWQIEWGGAPVRGPLATEVWHAADGRLRIETLEAPTTALSGLTLVNDGTTVWFYDLRQNRVESGPGEQVRIPLASDALDAMDWLFLELDNATVNVIGHDVLESGPTSRLAVTLLTSGDRATLWIHDETGLPARVELHSVVWGEATFTTRSISTTAPQPPALFTFQPPGADVVTPPHN